MTGAGANLVSHCTSARVSLQRVWSDSVTMTTAPFSSGSNSCGNPDAGVVGRGVGIDGAGRKLGNVARTGFTNGRPSIVVSQPETTPVTAKRTAVPRPSPTLRATVER